MFVMYFCQIPCYSDIMDSFRDSTHFSPQTPAGQEQQPSRLPLARPYIRFPERLSHLARTEMEYRYVYMSETVEFLADHYRLSVEALEEYIEINQIKRAEIDSQEGIKSFEQFIGNTYKQIKLKMSGMQVMHAAASFDTFIEVEKRLLRTLDDASTQLQQQQVLDPQDLSRLTRTHIALMERQDLLAEATRAPLEALEALREDVEELKWAIEVVGPDGQPMTLPGQEETDEETPVQDTP